MTDRSSSRVALDFDALEAGIAASGGAARGSGASEDARLAELARIVGQNDRFRDLLRMPAADDRQFQTAPVTQQHWDSPAPRHEEPAHMRTWVGGSELAGGHDAAQVHHANQDQWDAPHQPHAQMQPEPAWQETATAGQHASRGYAAYDQEPAAAYAHGSHPQGQAAYGQGPYDQEPYGHNSHGQNSHGLNAYERDGHDLHGGGAPSSGHPSGHYGAGRHDFAPAPDPLAAVEGARLRRQRPSRTPLYAAVGVVALCVAASAGYFGLRGGSSGGGEAPLIQADASAVRVKPPVEGNAAPAPTKEIYEQIAKPPGETKVVANNEQPVDVEQTLRQQRAAAVASGKLPSEVGDSGTFGAPGVAPLPTHAANRDPRAGLGEPRRVQTVSIGPDGKVRATGQPQVAAVQPPAGAAQAAVTPAAKTMPPVRPVQQAAVKQDHRVASTMVDNTTTGSLEAASAPKAVAPKAVAAAPAGKGGFAVQLGAPGSEQEAKTLAASLKRKYNVLASHNTAVVKAQANGRTIYRLRVPGLSRDSATSLCMQLKSVGGNCFVAQG